MNGYAEHARELWDEINADVVKAKYAAPHLSYELAHAYGDEGQADACRRLASAATEVDNILAVAAARLSAIWAEASDAGIFE